MPVCLGKSYIDLFYSHVKLDYDPANLVYDELVCSIRGASYNY